MNSLPPDASSAPQPADSEPDKSAAVPRWAVPAVPPPWSGTDQAAPGDQQPTGQQPAQVSVDMASAQVDVAPAQSDQAAAPAGLPGWGQPAWGQPGAAPQQFGQPAWGQPGAAPQQFGQPAWGQPGAAPQQFGQPGYGPPPWAQAGVAPAVASKPQSDRRKWMPTFVVAAIIAGVVLGGIGLDDVIAAPSAGTVNVGGSVTIVAAPGWVRVDTGDSGGAVELQKADVELTVAAELYSGTATEALQDAEQSLSSDEAQISFGDEQDGTMSGHETAMVGFEAIVSGSSGSGTVDGELICLLDAGNVVEFVAATSQGDLADDVDDLKAMISSIEVGQ